MNAHVGFSPSSDHESVQWQIILGGWDGTKSCIHAEGVGSHVTKFRLFEEKKVSININITPRRLMIVILVLSNKIFFRYSNFFDKIVV